MANTSVKKCKKCNELVKNSLWNCPHCGKVEWGPLIVLLCISGLMLGIGPLSGMKFKSYALSAVLMILLAICALIIISQIVRVAVKVYRRPLIGDVSGYVVYCYLSFMAAKNGFQSLGSSSWKLIAVRVMIISGMFSFILLIRLLFKAVINASIVTANETGHSSTALKIVSWFRGKATLPKIEQWGKKYQFKKLIEAKIDVHPDIRKAANKEIERLVDECVVKMKDKGMSRRQRGKAITMLGRSRSPKAVQPLIDVLKFDLKESNIELAIIDSLGLIGDERAIEPLTERLHWVEWGPDPSTVKVIRVTMALERIGSKKALEELSRFEMKKAQALAEYRAGKRYYCPYCHASISKFTFGCPTCRTVLRADY